MVRDHFGAKPLWHYQKGSQFTITTSLRSILNGEPDNSHEMVYRLNSLLEGDECHIKNIRKVAPGEYHTINLEKKTFKGYFQLLIDMKMRRDTQKLFQSMRSERTIII